jgi:ligand-binding sensor domain-containing protein
MNKYLIVLFLYFSLTIFSQERKNLQFIHYSTGQGLSSSEVSEIVQDKQGFIWVGTEDGLNRFDSYYFKVYRKKINDTTSLFHNFISTLFVDSKGDLWIGTQQGLS